MNKKDRKPRRLALHRETLLRLDDDKLRTAAPGGADALFSAQRLCTSPWCGPTTCGCAENA